MYLKKKVVNIAYDLFYPPATHLQIIKMYFFISRPADYPQHPWITVKLLRFVLSVVQ